MITLESMTVDAEDIVTFRRSFTHSSSFAFRF